MASRTVRIPKRQQMAERWRPLYEVAERVKELAPWRWITEKEIFGVQDPETGDLAFVSVMGTLGEHLSIGIYLGVNALHQFWDLEDLAPDANQWEISSRLFMIPQIQASFEDRDMLDKEDLGIIRRLKLNYDGHLAYPLFRSIQVGCPPYLLDTEKISFLTHVLEQTIDVASRRKEDDNLLYPDDVGNDGMYLLRVPTNVEGEIVWADEIRPVPFPDTESDQVLVIADRAAREKLLNIPRVGNSVEIDLFMLSRPIVEKKGGQPYFPFALLIVESDTGVVLSHELLSPLPSWGDMHRQIPQLVIDLLLANQMLPYEIHTQSYAITSVLSAIFNKSEMPIIELDSLPMLNEAKIAMLQHF